MFRVAFEVLKGWVYLSAFVTGGSFVRKAKLHSCGRRVKISPTVSFKFPGQIDIGDDSFINHLCCIWASQEGRISIGRDVLLGPGVTVISSNHGIERSTPIRLQPGQDADVTIGNDVWIGAHVVVTPGVTIGDGCVVGAGAVVTRNLPAHTICVGVPAKVLRQR